MKIQWNKVTWYSMMLAIVLYVGVFCIAFYLGQRSGELKERLRQAPAAITNTLS